MNTSDTSVLLLCNYSLDVFVRAVMWASTIVWSQRFYYVNSNRKSHRVDCRVAKYPFGCGFRSLVENGKHFTSDRATGNQEWMDNDAGRRQNDVYSPEIQEKYNIFTLELSNLRKRHTCICMMNNTLRYTSYDYDLSVRSVGICFMYKLAQVFVQIYENAHDGPLLAYEWRCIQRA